MPSPTTFLRTVADELLELVKKSNKISIEELAKKLRIPLVTAQALVDFLVEEKIFGMEYKFTTPYVYIYKEGIGNTKAKDKGVLKELISREIFYQKAKERKLPHEHIGGLWRKYLQQNLPKIREEFYRKARNKQVPEEKIEGLWKKYLSYL